MSETSKAVFLSYASQDAEAAKRIADALRAAGVEVWFDAEGGLEHGDEWDAKIRRQIKECVLFIPIISENTQAREEGYFRLEWDLAAERARTIASGVAFILPVLIDGTREPGALVPDRFRTVQWTKLPGGNVPPEVLQRFLKLWSHRAGALKAVEAGRPRPAAERDSDFAKATADKEGSPPPDKSRPGPRAYASVAAAIALVVAGVAWWFLRGSMPKAEQKPAPVPAANAAKTATADRTGFPKDPDLAKAITLTETLNSTVEDHALAEDLAKAVLARQPTDPETVIVNAYVANRFILRGFDLSEERYASSRRLCERALLLAPDNPEALHVMGQNLVFRQADLPRAVRLLRQAVALAPDRARFYNSYIEALDDTDPAEALQVAERAISRFPADAILRYRLALVQLTAGRGDAYEKALDETLAVGPVATAAIRKAMHLLVFHRDLAGARLWLDRVPGDFRLNDRMVFARYVCASVSGEVQDGLEALNALPGDFVRDFAVLPKRLLRGDLLERQGKPELAHVEYAAALADIAREKAIKPNLNFERPEIWLLMGLGRRMEARARINVAFQAAVRPVNLRGSTGSWLGMITTLLLLDEHAKALTLLREAVSDEWGRRLMAGTFAIDPHLAPFRDDPQITALLAEPKVEAATAPKVDDKSVAVLAFENLSDDKANEYFSDGVAEELLTVLQKIPGLHVAARTSAFFFKGRNATAQEIGEKLGVATLVEGSVRKAGNTVRITARLSRAATGEQLWSESYTRDLKDVFAVQSELAETIVGQLRGQLGLAATRAEIQAQVQAAEKGGTKNPEAHELYLQGKYFLNRATLADTARATTLLQRAVELDPSFALAWAALSGAGWFRGGYGLNRQDFDEGFALARRAADQAVAIEPALAAGHIARLDLQASTDFDWKGAKESLRRAQALAPDDVAVIFRGAQLAYSFGQMDRAVDLIRKTGALDPVNPLVYTNAGYIFLSLHRFDEAVAAFRRVCELSPASPWGHAGVAMTLVAAGRSEEAAAEAALETNMWSRRYTQSLAEWGRKNRAAADKVLAEFIASDAEVAAYQIACAYAWRGEADQAFEWLERAYRQRDPGLGWARADFYLQSLHNDPRWPAFMKELGVVDQQLP
jgi:TolB-like protein/Tfp pilus assembly protein PilF